MGSASGLRLGPEHKVSFLPAAAAGPVISSPCPSTSWSADWGPQGFRFTVFPRARSRARSRTLSAEQPPTSFRTSLATQSPPCLLRASCPRWSRPATAPQGGTSHQPTGRDQPQARWEGPATGPQGVWERPITAGGKVAGIATMEGGLVRWCLRKLRTELPYDPAGPLLGLFPKLLICEDLGPLCSRQHDSRRPRHGNSQCPAIGRRGRLVHVHNGAPLSHERTGAPRAATGMGLRAGC